VTPHVRAARGSAFRCFSTVSTATTGATAVSGDPRSPGTERASQSRSSQATPLRYWFSSSTISSSLSPRFRSVGSLILFFTRSIDFGAIRRLGFSRVKLNRELFAHAAVPLRSWPR